LKYVDASAIVRVLFGEPGPAVRLTPGDRVASSHVVEVETFRAIDRARLLGHLTDVETVVKRKELGELLARLDLVPVDASVIERARSSFAVNARALDAIHVGTAEILVSESEGEDAGLEFWTHDDRQGVAALSRGLTVRGTR
jgi:predicted nucleic acid-binding protein